MAARDISVVVVDGDFLELVKLGFPLPAVAGSWCQPKKCLLGCEKIPHWFFSELFLASLSDTRLSSCVRDPEGLLPCRYYKEQ